MQLNGEVLWCMTLLMNVIVLVLEIQVVVFEGIPSLFVVVARHVKASNSKKS